MSQIVQTWETEVTGTHAYRVRVQVEGDVPSCQHVTAILDWVQEQPTGSPPPVNGIIKPDAPGRRVPPASLPPPVNGIIKRVFLARTDSGWTGMHVAPPDATRLRVVVFDWRRQPSRTRRATFQFAYEEAPVPPVRKLKLGVAYQQTAEPPTREANRSIMIDTVLEAGRQDIELLCLSENFVTRGVPGPAIDRAMAVDDPFLAPVWEAIVQAGSHVCFSMIERAGERTYNTSLLVSPDGKIVGAYRKRNLTLAELEAGLTPGETSPVFETALGKIGMLICWDAWFPSSVPELAVQGAEIVCLPLAGDGTEAHWDHVWRARAMDSQVFLMTSVTGNCGGTAPSRILAPDGSVLAETRTANGLASAMIELPFVTESYWLSVGPYWAERRNVMEQSRLLTGGQHPTRGSA